MHDLRTTPISICGHIDRWNSRWIQDCSRGGGYKDKRTWYIMHHLWFCLRSTTLVCCWLYLIVEKGGGGGPPRSPPSPPWICPWELAQHIIIQWMKPCIWCSALLWLIPFSSSSIDICSTYVKETSVQEILSTRREVEQETVNAMCSGLRWFTIYT